MDFPRKQIKANARAALSANYWPVVGILLLGGLLASAVSVIASIPSYVSIFSSLADGSYPYGVSSGSTITTVLSVVGVLLTIIFQVGISWFAYLVYRGDEPDVANLFVAFKGNNFPRVLGGMLLVMLYTFLWSLLFLIPGIIKSYQYYMMPYLLVDRPDLSIKECFAMSKQMTDGHKWHLFVLDISFIGWAILACFTLGILDIFYVVPYQTLAQAGAYDYLKRTRMPQPVQQGPVFQSATYEANYTETNYTETSSESKDTWQQPEVEDNDNIFDE